MKKEKGSTRHILESEGNFKYVLIMEGLACGLLAGLIAIIYRLLLGYAEQFIAFMASVIWDNLLYIIGWFLFLLVLGVLIGWCLKQEPLISGSGIPQVEGEIISFLDQKWYKILPYKIVAGTLCAFGGLSLGREGPSIQLGAMGGKGMSRIFHRVKMEEKLLLTCGAAAGLSAAFNAPLAGVMFALEEVHKNFSVSVLVSVMCASVTGDFLSQYVFGLEPAFHFVVTETLPLGYYGSILLLGIICGLCGVLYNKMTLKFQDWYEKVPRLKAHYRVLIPLMIAGALMLILPEVLGSGHTMIEMLSGKEPLLLKTLILLLVVKFIFSLASFGSGAPGGIFFPLLVLGSFVGAIYGLIAIQYFQIPEMYLANFIIMAMAAFFAAIVRAPITGIILIAEMSGTLTHLLPLALVSLCAYLTANILNCDPIYESLLHKLLWKNGVNLDAFQGKKHIVEAAIEIGSEVCEKKVSDIAWPGKCLIISIHRGNAEIIPKGDTVLFTGDTLMALINDEDAPYVQHALEKLCTRKLS